MSIVRVRAFLNKRGMADRVREFPVSSATVQLAAQALGCEPCRIAKTLSFKTPDGVILIVMAGDSRVDNPKFKARFNAKATMLSPEEVASSTGYEVGGVCPFDIKPPVRVYLDSLLRRFSTVFPACGSANSAIELTLPELEQLSSPSEWIDVAKLPPAEA